uniref:Uncharacterized protein n=1 Tax=Lynx canadensis TaxID=61383 RepID=A0A667I956_LYNCA
MSVPLAMKRAASGHTRRKLQGKLPELQAVKTELCYNVNWTADSLPSAEEMRSSRGSLAAPCYRGDVAQESWLRSDSSDLLLEVGPRLNFSTPASTNVVSVCWAAGLGAGIAWRLPGGTCSRLPSPLPLRRRPWLWLPCMTG